MKKRYSTRLITSRRSYSTLELAKLLDTHPQTIRTWRTKGLQAIDATTHSPLFFGSDVKRFLVTQHQKVKTQLKSGEFYCLRCREAVEANNLSTKETGNTIGGKYISIMFSGLCQKCGSKVRKFGIVTNQLSSGQVGINTEPTSPLYHSLQSGKDQHVQQTSN